MIYEALRIKEKVGKLSFTNRTELTDEFLETLPKNTKLYQTYFMGKEEQLSKEVVTVELLEAFAVLTDIERTRLMEISRTMVVKKDA